MTVKTESIQYRNCTVYLDHRSNTVRTRVRYNSMTGSGVVIGYYHSRMVAEMAGKEYIERLDEIERINQQFFSMPLRGFA